MTDLKRDDETWAECARRNAIDAGYHERDNGGTMHTAGEAAARVTAEIIAEALNYAYHPQNPATMHPADFVVKAFGLDGHEGLLYG